jgi:hypothetical protein
MFTEYGEKYLTASSIDFSVILTFDPDCACRYVVFTTGYKALQTLLSLAYTDHRF